MLNRALVTLCAFAASLTAAGPVRVLILSGANNHDWRTTTPAIRRVLDLAPGRFDVRVNETPAALNEAALANFDVIVFDYNGPRLGAAAEGAIERFVSGGKGLVAVHAAGYAFSGMEILGDRHVRTGKREPAWPAWSRMLGGVWTETPRTGHGDRHEFAVRWTDREHPVARGLAESFTADDELYHNLRLNPDAHVIARALSSTERKGTGKDEPVLWTVPFGKGRVFHMTLGHDAPALVRPGVANALQRGTEWAATGGVTLPEPKPRIRVLTLTAGHDHQPSFYSFLDNDPALDVTIDPTGDFFRADLRKRYDVLLLYNMRDDFDEARRKNLRAFVEAGKGVVSTHHSLASFHSWEWWWHDVAGGHYFEKPQGEYKAATYQHDIHLTAHPVGTHPVLKGIDVFDLYDEGYKGMWISPQVTPLLRAEHPASDPVLAWISPYQQARVVVVQPGHGKESHDHPQWRRLVRNAILWSAGQQP